MKQKLIIQNKYVTKTEKEVIFIKAIGKRFSGCCHWGEVSGVWTWKYDFTLEDS